LVAGPGFEPGTSRL